MVGNEPLTSPDVCDRCQRTTHDLRVVLFWGRNRRTDRYVCATCAEELFRLFLSAASHTR
jgi:hypothetical protein